MSSVGARGPAAPRPDAISEAADHPSHRLLAVLPWALLAAGAALRIVYFMRAGGLWGDETMLALNIASRTWRELTTPLDYAQLAPVPFLWAERAAFVLLGPGDHAFRIVSLLAGLAVLPLCWLLARAVVGRTGALVALSMIATSGLLLRYAAELKPYSLDAAVAAALALVAIRELKVDGTGRIPWRLLLTGCVALLLSLPSTFVCAGVVAAVGLTAIRRRDTRGLMVAVGLAVVWAALFGATYQVWYRPVASSPYMQQFWEATFLRPGTPALAARFGQAWEDTALGVSVLGGFIPGFLAALALLGLVMVARRRSIPVAIVLGGPLLLAFAGSVAGRYPIASRTTLFATPALAILIGAALEALVGWARYTAARIPAQAAVFVLVIFPALIAARLTFSESDSEDVEAAVRQFAARAHAGEPVYLYHRATTSWTFYTTDWMQPDIRRLAWTARVAGPDGPGFTNAAPRGPRRVDDGAALVYQVAGRTELLGTASGIRARHWLGYQPAHADSGWVDNEVRRIQSAAQPTIWLVFADHLHGPIRDGEWLVDGVRHAGGVIEWADEHPFWALYRVRFNRPASP